MTAWIQNSKQKECVDVAKRKDQEYIQTKTGMTVDKPDPVGAGGTTGLLLPCIKSWLIQLIPMTQQALVYFLKSL